MAVDKPRFWQVHCSQCGGTFGPGDSGYSHCEDHAGLSPNNTAWSLPAEWLADMAEALEHVRHEDGGPKLLKPEAGRTWGRERWFVQRTEWGGKYVTHG